MGDRWGIMGMFLEVGMLRQSWEGFWVGLGGWRGGFVVKESGCGRSIENIGIIQI